MALYEFGAGVLWGTPLTDANSVAIANPTPVLFGVLQDVSVDISFDTKMLHGQNQFPEAIGRGKGKITGKAKFARMNGLLLNSMFFGQTVTSSLLADYYDTTGAAIPTTPFQITPTIPSAGTWSRDLGVRDNTGNPMVVVPSAPATGQYSVTAGVYTFATADTGKTVFISYQYTATSTSAKTSIVSNVQMGNAPTFRADLFAGFGGKQTTLSLYSCLASKMSLATKLDDFTVPEMDFDAFADPSGRVMQWGTGE
jgi:hypothetical protein